MSANMLVVGLVLGVISGQTAAAQRGSAIRFQGMDSNHDGRITRAEWKGSEQSFKVHDWNGDGVLSGDEVRPGGRRGQRQNREQEFDGPDRDYQFDDWTARGFSGIDDNRDNRITADEWHFDRESFRRADHNRDGVISRSEFLSEGSTRSQAYQAGRDRGLIEGRAAGREDRERNQGWDLDGQRELEQADSGYEARMGPRADYQTGYREAFRIGYREGFGRR